MSSSLFSNSQTQSQTGIQATQVNGNQTDTMTQRMEQLKPLLSTAKMFKMSNNPMGMLEMASASNPQLQTILSQTQAANNPKEAFIMAARNKGMTDEQINQSIINLQEMWKTI